MSDQAKSLGVVALLQEPSAKYLASATQKDTEGCGWQTLPLGRVLKFQRGFDLPHRTRRTGPVPVVSSAGTTDFHDVAQALAPGVVTGRYGTIGQLFYLEENFWPLNTTLYVRDFQGNVPKFVYYLLHSFDFGSFSGKSGVPGVNRNDLHAEDVSLPQCVEEQRAIATALSDVDALIAGLERLIAKKRDIKQAAMQQLLTGQTRLPGFSGEWEAKRLADVGDCLRGVAYRGDADLFPHDTGQTKRLLRSNNVQNATVVATDVQFVNSACVSEHQILRAGDVLICMANGSKALVGKAGYFDRDDGFEYTFGAFMGVFRCTDVAERRFVFYLFQTSRYRDYINNLLAGSSINNLTPASVMSLEFSLPEKAEQTAIATVLSDMDANLTALESRLAKTRAIKQGMMQELLTGRTRLI
jgi:type I restriction enzyme S subunit